MAVALLMMSKEQQDVLRQHFDEQLSKIHQSEKQLLEKVSKQILEHQESQSAVFRLLQEESKSLQRSMIELDETHRSQLESANRSFSQLQFKIEDVTSMIDRSMSMIEQIEQLVQLDQHSWSAIFEVRITCGD